jgi:hypothetical protein
MANADMRIRVNQACIASEGVTQYFWVPHVPCGTGEEQGMVWVQLVLLVSVFGASYLIVTRT